jgi:hypothetical protein
LHRRRSPRLVAACTVTSCLSGAVRERGSGTCASHAFGRRVGNLLEVVLVRVLVLVLQQQLLVLLLLQLHMMELLLQLILLLLLVQVGCRLRL